MDKEFEDKSMSTVAGSSKGGESTCNWHEQEPREQKLFRNNLMKINCSVENSTESNVNETLQGELKNDVQEEIIFQLLFNNASVYDRNANGDTFLHAAFKEGCYDALRSALSNLTFNFDPANKDDVIHFHLACVTNHYIAAENFIKCGLDPNIPFTLDKAELSGLTPMEYAIQKNYSELFVTLLKSNCDLSRKNAKGLSPLHMIYYSKFENNGKSWFEQAFKLGNDKKLVNLEDEHGVTHFHLCCTTDQPDFIQTFISNGANVNNQVSLTCPLNPGYTPLHFAVISGCEKVTELLLISGADPNKPDKEGKTPLHLAAEIMGEFSNNTVALVNIVRILLDYKANPIITDRNGATPLHVSFYKARTRIFNIVKTLILELNNNWGSTNYTDEHGLSLFHIACAKNVYIPILKFLKSGADVNSRVSSGAYSGYTALHFAVMFDRCKKQKVLQLLLERGAKVNEIEDEFGYTPLGVVFEKLQFPSIARSIPRLLKYKASTVIPDKKGRTPLHKCLYNIDKLGYKMFDILISKTQWGSENHIDDQGLSLFHIACTTGDVAQVTEFLDSGVNVYGRVTSGMYDGFTGLHFAVMHNQKRVVEILLKRHFIVNDRAGLSATTPLHLACELNSRKFNPKYNCCNQSNQLNIIKLLLLHGAEVDAKDSYGMTPLLIACTIDNHNQMDWSDIVSAEYNTSRLTLHHEISIRLEEVIKILISNNADINMRTTDQSTALHIICKYKILKNSDGLVKLLLTSGVEVNSVNAAGLTPLHLAVRHNSNNLLTSLLNNKANPNIKCNHSRPPLHLSADQLIFRPDQAEYLQEKRDTFSKLLEYGCDVNASDGRGRLLLHKAVRSCTHFLIDNLLKYGADINMEDSHGYCCVEYLLDRGSDQKLLNTLKLIFDHMKWREALKLPISPKVQQLCTVLYVRHEMALEEDGEYDRVNEHFVQCCAELDKLKSVNIDMYTSLYDVLKKTPHDLVKNVKNDDLLKIARDKNIHKNYPLYGYLLKRQIESGLKRSELTQFADVALRNVLNLSLPDPCCDLVLKNLTNEEVSNLIKAAPTKRNLIRKSCDNESENETVSKLRKTQEDQ